MSDCIFCQIADHEIEAKIIYEDDLVIAFDDINPQLPIHSLVIPKKHYHNLDDDVPAELLGHILKVVSEVARVKGVDKTGYRVVTNVGEDGRQTVMHLHVHMMGGAKMPIRMGPAD